MPLLIFELFQRTGQATKFLEDFMCSENYICTLFESQVDSNLDKFLCSWYNTVMSVSDPHNVVRKSFR